MKKTGKYRRDITEQQRRMKIGQRIRQQLTPWMSREDVAKHFGISGQRVDQIETLALAKLAIRLSEITGFEIKL